MKKPYLFLAAGLLTAGISAPVLASWTLAKHGVATPIAAGKLVVTPGEEWNRNSRKPVKVGEQWTLDGTTLNELYLVSGLPAGQTLFKDFDKKNNPLPKFASSLQLTEIPEFFETTSRIALKTSVFKILGVGPAKLGSQNAVKFTYEYAVQGSALTMRGVAVGAVVGQQLYLISFSAPSIYYFDRDRAKAEAIMDSAKL